MANITSSPQVRRGPVKTWVRRLLHIFLIWNQQRQSTQGITTNTTMSTCTESTNEQNLNHNTCNVNWQVWWKCYHGIRRTKTNSQYRYVTSWDMENLSFIGKLSIARINGLHKCNLFICLITQHKLMISAKYNYAFNNKMTGITYIQSAC